MIGARQPASTDIVTAPVVGLAEAGSSSLLTVRLPTGRLASVPVAAVPDHGLARQVTIGLRRLAWVCLALDGDGRAVESRFAGAARHPVQRTVPAAAALGLLAAGVPTLVSFSAAALAPLDLTEAGR